MIQPLRPVAAERLADRLAEITPGDLAITTFTNSGAETVEAAIKLARVRTGRDRILSTWNGFHGKTLGALSATGKPLYQKDFAAPAPGFDYVPFGDLAALEARLEAEADEIAAFIVEPIQGEGGVVVPPEGYIDGVIALCRKYGVLSILDEIQTGLGRTGALFACAEGDEVPDMLLLAKALGGGMMPIGACIVRAEAWDDRFGRLHSSTFANNNLACTVADATLDKLLADDAALIGQVRENGARFRAQLEALQARYPEVIREVRGRGYMVGLEFQRFDAQSHSATMAFSSLNGGVTALISSHLLNVHGLLTAPLFNESHVMRLQPPLIASRDELDRVIDALETVCDILARRDYSALVRHLVREARRRAHRAGRHGRARPQPPGRRTRTGAVRLPHPLHRGRGHLPLRPVLPAVRRRGAFQLAGLGEAARPRLCPRDPEHHVQDRRHRRGHDPVGADAAPRHAGPRPRQRHGDDQGRRGHGGPGRHHAGGPWRLHLDRDPWRRYRHRARRADHQRQHPDHGGGGEGHPERRPPHRARRSRTRMWS